MYALSTYLHRLIWVYQNGTKWCNNDCNNEDGIRVRSELNLFPSLGNEKLNV